MMPEITRAIRAEIIFPDWRKADLFGDGGDGGDGSGAGLYKRLWRMKDDVTRACNRLMSALFQLEMGTIEHPLSPDGKSRPKKGYHGPLLWRKTPPDSLAYQGLSGKWQPFGKPMYRPSTRPVSSAILVEASRQVSSRLKTDLLDVKRGKRSLPTFRSLPLMFPAKTVKIDDDGHISLLIHARGGGSTRVKVAWRKLSEQRVIFDRIRAGSYKLGACKLQWHQPPGRKGRWMLSMSWTGHAEDSNSDGQVVVAGVHLGIMSTASVAYIREDGVLLRRRDILEFPEQAVRAWRRTRKERRRRLVYNRDEVGARQGRGRQRKGRVVRATSGKLGRLVDTTVEQLAAQVVASAKRRGASVIAIENLTHWSKNIAMDELLRDGTNAERARHRRWYFSWHQGAVRAAIRSTAEREGMAVVEVEASGVSTDCNACGVSYAGHGVYLDRKKGKPLVGPEGTLGGDHPRVRYGRITWTRFRCRCGTEVHAERNASVNVARRGLARVAKKAA